MTRVVRTVLANNMSSHSIWQYFSKEGEEVVCKQCKKSYSAATSKSSYTSLWYHLRVSHSIDRPQAEISESKAKRPRTQQKLIVSYAEKKCQDKMYAALAATDRLSFNQIANSSFIKDAMGEKEEMTLVKDIISALGPFKTATELLCKRDSNLAQAEVIIKFVDKK